MFLIDTPGISHIFAATGTLVGADLADVFLVSILSSQAHRT